MKNIYNSFEEVVEEHYKGVLSFFRFKGLPYDEAQDFVQETWLKAYQNFSCLEDHHSAGAWLRAIARNVFINHFQRAQRFSVSITDDNVAEELQIDSDASEHIIQDERLRALRSALLELPPKMQEVVFLRLFQDLKYKEIASAMGLEVNTVKSHLNQAKKKLKDSVDNCEL